MNGRGSLAGLMPYSNANDVVVDMASDVLPVVKHTPVIAGVCASDPGRDMTRFLRQLKDLGFAGVQNFPTVGLIDGNFRQNLEETGMGYGSEVEMVRIARGMGLVTTPYVFNPEEARLMAEAGADVIVAHSKFGLLFSCVRLANVCLAVGLTSSGTIGAKTGKSLEQCVEDIQAIQAAAQKVRQDVIVLCHGGPIAKPEDARFVLERCKGLHGFFGASSMERLPVEEAIAGVTREFKGIPISK
jgi:predicted TIM-barrel enzyme